MRDTAQAARAEALSWAGGAPLPQTSLSLQELREHGQGWPGAAGAAVPSGGRGWSACRAAPAGAVSRASLVQHVQQSWSGEGDPVAQPLRVQACCPPTGQGECRPLQAWASQLGPACAGPLPPHLQELRERRQGQLAAEHVLLRLVQLVQPPRADLLHVRGRVGAAERGTGCRAQHVAGRAPGAARLGRAAGCCPCQGCQSASAARCCHSQRPAPATAALQRQQDAGLLHAARSQPQPVSQRKAPQSCACQTIAGRRCIIPGSCMRSLVRGARPRARRILCSRVECFSMVRLRSTRAGSWCTAFMRPRVPPSISSAGSWLGSTLAPVCRFISCTACARLAFSVHSTEDVQLGAAAGWCCRLPHPCSRLWLCQLVHAGWPVHTDACRHRPSLGRAPALLSCSTCVSRSWPA